jgi:addiction module HigA family antidote
MATFKNGMRPIHPGEILREEFLVPMKLSAHALAIALHVPAPRINDIVRERRGVTADTALRLSRFFGMSDGFWIGLQADYDTAKARDALSDVLSRIHPFTAAVGANDDSPHPISVPHAA